jgi:hypothetical protein
VSYSAIIIDPAEPDAMPLWESVEYPDFDAALKAGQAYIHATHPADRLVEERHGIYGIWGGTSPAKRVATLLVEPTSDTDPQLTRRGPQ